MIPTLNKNPNIKPKAKTIKARIRMALIISAKIISTGALFLKKEMNSEEFTSI